MPGREDCDVGVPELVVSVESQAETLAATLLAALTNELPTRRIPRVDPGREVADAAIHLSKRLAHDTLLKSRLP